MTEDLRNLVWRAYEGARPYLDNSNWIAPLLERLTQKTTDLNSLKTLLKTESSSIDDATKRTDVSIYLSHLERSVKRTHSHG